MNALAATTYTVNTTADTSDGACGSTCSLRDAITAANGAAGNTINFTGLSGTITLTSALPEIHQDMTIMGPGASDLTISGNNAYQIFYISGGAVTISGLTLANGNGCDGCAIASDNSLTVTDSIISGNVSGFGAIYETNGTLTVTGSAFIGNFSNNGGAIYNLNGTTTVINSTFSGNSATTEGGAIYNNGILTSTNSTFSGNSTGGGGGAVYTYYGTAAVTNSTFSGNSASTGGAILNYSGTLTANNNVFAGNIAEGFNSGAAVWNDFVGGATTNAAYNLYFQNLDSEGTEDDCNQCTSNTNAITGSNPNLLPLGYYGGPTETMLLQPGSPAICAGSYADVPNGVTTDERGFPLTNSTCSNGGVDVGAVQSDYVQVTTTADSGVGSLRAAMTAANATSYGGDIDFAPGVTGTITLASTLFSTLQSITESTNIVGPGAGNLTISGNNAYGILSNAFGSMSISGLTFANGNSAGGGGAIFNQAGVLTVTNAIFSGNSGGGGGAINNFGTLAVTDTTFAGNSALSGSSGFGYGGGAISSQLTLTVSNCTFSGNSADVGGAIDGNNNGTLTVTNSTFSGNSATNDGGAIFTDGTLMADNNISLGNSAVHGAGIYQAPLGGIVNTAYSLYYQNLDAGGTEDDCNGCTSNTNAITGSDPLLAPLGNFGGPTQTMLPQPGSPAICAGSTSLIPGGLTSDQRGFSRTTAYNGTACLDLGAVQTNYTAAAFSSSSYSGVANQNVNPAPVVTVTENGQNVGGVPITLLYSGTGSPTGLGPMTTVGGTGATFSSLTASSPAQGTLTVSLPITASENSVQPTPLSASASLNINSGTQTITFVTPASLSYGYAPITLSATGGGSGNPVTFSLDSTSTPGAASLSGSTLAITGVGTVVIDANQAAGGGYSAATQVQQSIVINPASLTITASSPTVTYGSPVPTITPIFGNFFNGDTNAVLTSQPTCVTAYTVTSAVGSSPSTSCSGAAAVNYVFTYIQGSVTVTQAPAFALSGQTGSITITRGATTGNTIAITVSPSNGFTGTVNLACSIAPVGVSNPPTCSLSPGSVSITGTGSQSSTLTIITTANTAENQLKPLLWPSAGTTLALVLMIAVPRRRRSFLAVLCVLAFSIAFGAIGCGGNGGRSSGGNSGTTPGAYTVTVTGTSGSITGTAATITLNVQ